MLVQSELATAAVLRGAANVLATRGWIQGSLTGFTGYCAIGAIWEVDYGNWQAAEAVEKGLGIFDMCPPDGLQPLANWNDTQGRTVAEVIEAMESTALALEVRALAAESVSANPELPVVAETPSFTKVGV